MVLTDEQLARIGADLECDRYPNGVVTQLLAEHAALKARAAELERERDLLRSYYQAHDLLAADEHDQKAQRMLLEACHAIEAHDARAAKERATGGEPLT